MANKTGYALAITAFIAIGATLESQLATLTAVKEAQDEGDFTALFALAEVDKFTVKQKTIRVPDAAPTETATTEAETAEAGEAEPDPVLDAAPAFLSEGADALAESETAAE